MKKNNQQRAKIIGGENIGRIKAASMKWKNVMASEDGRRRRRQRRKSARK